MPDIGPQRAAPGSKAARLFYRGVGVAAVSLAVAGVAVPGLPSTPFALLAFWAFSRGAPEWADRLRRHPKLGPLLQNWEEHRAIPRGPKVAAALGVTASWLAFAALVQNLIASIALAVVLVTVLAYVLTRPSS